MEEEKQQEQFTPKPLKAGIFIKCKKICKKIIRQPKKLIIALVVLAVTVLGAWYLATDVLKPKPKSVYTALVVVRSQSNSDPVEDRRSSLKAGDVLLISEEGHQFSRTEQVSYLILKMELTEEQRQKLLLPNEKEIDFDDLSEEEQKRIKDEEQRARDESREYEPEPRTETLRARAYRIDLEELGFTNPDSLIRGQPYADQVFDWSIVERKPKIK